MRRPARALRAWERQVLDQERRRRADRLERMVRAREVLAPEQPPAASPFLVTLDEAREAGRGQD